MSHVRRVPQESPFLQGFLPVVGLIFFVVYRGADKSLAQPGRKQATATEDFDVHISQQD